MQKLDLQKGTFSRRELLGVAAGVGATAMFGALPHDALAQQPKKGGRLRAGWYTHSANDTIDPTRLNPTLDRQRALQVMSTLVRYAPQAKLDPELAEKWETTDAKTWVFHIRQGVEFHNGKTLQAEDVVFSLSRHLGAKSTSIVKSLFADVASIAADGNNIVKITLNQPNADLAYYLADPHTCISPANFLDFDHAIGTGPFQLVRFQPGVGSLTKRNPNFFRSGLPYLDEVEMFGIPDPVNRTNALLAGDVHFICRVDPQSAEAINKSPNAKAVTTKTGWQLTFPMMCDLEPTSNKNLRLALKNLVDREGMLKLVRQGYGQIGNDDPLSPVDPYYKAIPQRTYDVDKAKFYLRKGGVENIELTLFTSDAVVARSTDYALHLKESAAAAGVKINVQREPNEGYWDNIWIKRPFTMAQWLPRPTADLRFSFTYESTAKWNDAHWKNETFDRYLKEARGTLDEKLRGEIYGKMQELIHDDGGTIIPIFMDFIDAKSNKLQNYIPSPISEGAGDRLAEAVWLEP